MKLILMSTPTFFLEEHQILRALFDEGLEIFHLRKPGTEPIYSERLLSLLPESYRKHIVVHDHFYLKSEYKLKGIHLNERNTTLPNNYKGGLSCSCRSLEELPGLKKSFDYVIYQQLFEEWGSKATMLPTGTLLAATRAKNIDKKVMAMGNIDLDNISFAKDLGFGGAVLLGTIWNRFNTHTTQDFKDIITHFRKLRKAAGY